MISKRQASAIRDIQEDFKRLSLKEKVETCQSIATILALIAGAAWTYQVFIAARTNVPRANITHNATHLQLSESINLLQVAVEISNTGQALLHSRHITIRIQRISPLPDCSGGERCVANEIRQSLATLDNDANSYSWPRIARRKSMGRLLVEPGETDIQSYEFAVPAWVETVRIYTFIENEQRGLLNKARMLFGMDTEEFGWSRSTYYTLKDS